MTHRQMWQAFCCETGVDAPYEAWAFGCDADELAKLVLNGRKTATAGLQIWYERENLELPQVGEYSVILDANANAVCVIQTTKVSVVPFCNVGDDQAWKEGEGDRTLAYWRKVHEAFFSEELSTVGIPFETDMNVVCEEFLRVYP